MDERSTRNERNREQKTENDKGKEFTIDWLGRKRFHPTPGVFFTQAAYEEYSVFHNPPPSGLGPSAIPQSPKAIGKDVGGDQDAQHTSRSETTADGIVSKSDKAKGKKKTQLLKTGPEKTKEATVGPDNKKLETTLPRPRNDVVPPTEILLNGGPSPSATPKKACTSPSSAFPAAPVTANPLSSNRTKTVESAPISKTILPLPDTTIPTPFINQKEDSEILNQPSENDIQQPSLGLDFGDFPNIESFYNDDTTFMDDSIFLSDHIPDDANFGVQTPAEAISGDMPPLSAQFTSPSDANFGAEAIDLQIAAHSQLASTNLIDPPFEILDESQNDVEAIVNDNSPMKGTEANRQSVADVPSGVLITGQAVDAPSNTTLDFAASYGNDTRNDRLPLDLQIAAQSIMSETPELHFKSDVSPQKSSGGQSHTQKAESPKSTEILPSTNTKLQNKATERSEKSTKPKKLSISIPIDMQIAAQAVHSGTKLQFDRSPSPAIHPNPQIEKGSPERGTNFRFVGSVRSRIHSTDGTPVSSLSVAEHHKYLQLVALAKATPNLLTEADHSAMKRIKLRVDREVEAYRQYWFEITKPRLTYLHDTVSTAIERPLNAKRTELLKKYPKLWESSCSISLMRPPAKSPPVLQYKATLLRRGKACRFVPPKLDHPINLTSDFRSFWCTDPKREGADASYWKKMSSQKVTEDPFIEPLIRENKPQVVISSSGMACFAALALSYDGSWDIPIRITQESSDVSTCSLSPDDRQNSPQAKTVYIEKPLPKQALTARERNRIYFSAAFESLCLDPKHRITLGEQSTAPPHGSTLKQETTAILPNVGPSGPVTHNESRSDQVFESPNLGPEMDLSGDEPDTLHLDNVMDHSHDEDVRGETGTIKPSETADGEKEKNATKDDSEAFIYTMWNIGGISVLVRCKIHGLTIGDGGQNLSVGFKVKLEYQWDRGPEVVTAEERSRWWTYAYIRGDTSLALGRVDVGTGVLVSVERLELSNLSRGPDWEAVHHHMLHYLLEKLCALPAGNYILSHSRGAEVLQLRRAVTEPLSKKPTDDLHALYSAPPALDRVTIQYAPTEWVGPSDQIPSTFRPDVPVGANAGVGKRGVFHNVSGVNYCRNHAAAPGSCTWGNECKYPHISLAEAQQIAKSLQSPASSSPTSPTFPISPTTDPGTGLIVPGVKHCRERPIEESEEAGMRERLVVKHCFAFASGICDRAEECPYPHLTREQIAATKSTGGKKTKYKKTKKQKVNPSETRGTNVASGGNFFD